jgi:hypothetical protein
MTTTCLTCNVSTGVGEMYGRVGLPSLDEKPRGRGTHRLSKRLSTGGDADTDETFGFIEAGFRALGLSIHSLDRYRAFLARHGDHRLFEWYAEENDDALPPELRGEDKTKFEEYRPPKKAEGYVRATLVFECSRCRNSFEGSSPDWVKPFAPKTLTPDEIKLFRKHVAQPAEYNVHEAEPFEILYMDLDQWLTEHSRHTVTMKLVS